MDLESWIKENEGLLVHLSEYSFNKGGYPTHLSINDLVQEAKIALIEAYDRYDESRGSFKSFGYQVIKQRFMSINEEYEGIDERTTVIAEDYEPSVKPRDAHKRLLSILYRGIKEQLNNRQYRFLTAYYGLMGNKEKDYVELAEQEGLTKQRLEQIISKAEDKLREWIKNHGYNRKDVLKNDHRCHG